MTAIYAHNLWAVALGATAKKTGTDGAGSSAGTAKGKGNPRGEGLLMGRRNRRCDWGNRRNPEGSWLTKYYYIYHDTLDR